MSDVIRAYPGRLVISNFILDETGSLARDRLGRQVAHKLGTESGEERIARLRRIKPRDEAAAGTLFERYLDKRFSLTDCTSYALVKQRLRAR